MAGGRASFEIQVMRDSAWVTEDIVATEADARTVLKARAAKAHVTSVRIVKNWERADGTLSETVVHIEQIARAAPPMTVIPIDEAPLCAHLPDYYAAASRSTINRLLRKYIDTAFHTPTEILHNFKAFKRFQDADSLFPAAVDRVAAIQAKVSGADAKVRRDEIFEAAAKIAERAKKADGLACLPALRDNNVAQLLKSLSRVVAEDEVPYYGLVVLSRELTSRRDWLAKLDWLVGLLPSSADPASTRLLDGIFADLMGVPSLVQDILGDQPDLAQALCTLADLCGGRLAAPVGEERGSDGREQVLALCPLLGQGVLEETRQSLVERLIRQVAGGQPLSRLDPAKEHDSFRRVAGRVVLAPDPATQGPATTGASPAQAAVMGLLGGPEMAAALTRRFAAMQERGGQKALREAVGGVSMMLNDGLSRVIYLTQLSQSKLAVDLKAEIRMTLRNLLGANDIAVFVPQIRSIRDRLLQVTRMHSVLAAATGLGGEDRQSFCARIDHLLVSYIVRERIVEKLDDPQAPLRDRATRLIEFCAAQVLPAQSRAQSLARERVVEILRQPNFETKFLDGITDPAQREERLRRLRATLARGGFG